MLESGSWGHSVLQTPALVLFIYLLFFFFFFWFEGIKHSLENLLIWRVDGENFFSVLNLFLVKIFIFIYLFFHVFKLPSEGLLGNCIDF